MINITEKGQERLLHVVDDILPDEPNRFDMGFWGNMDYDIIAEQQPACGTVACLSGWGILQEYIKEDLKGVRTSLLDTFDLPTGESLYHYVDNLTLESETLEQLISEWEEVHGEFADEYRTVLEGGNLPSYMFVEEIEGYEESDMLSFEPNLPFLQGMLVYGINAVDAGRLFFVDEWSTEYEKEYDDSKSPEERVEVTRNYVEDWLAGVLDYSV